MISKKKQRILDEMNNPATNEMDMNRTAIHFRNKDWWQIALLASEQKRSANDLINEAIIEYVRNHKKTQEIRDALSERVSSLEKKITILQEEYDCLKQHISSIKKANDSTYHRIISIFILSSLIGLLH